MNTAKPHTEGFMQACLVAMLRRIEEAGAPMTFAGDMNAAKRGGKARAEAKSTGMRAGEPDLRIYLPNGTLLLIELKLAAKHGGRVSKEQKERHETLGALGFEVHVIQTSSVIELLRRVRDMIGFHLPTQWMILALAYEETAEDLGALGYLETEA